MRTQISVRSTGGSVLSWPKVSGASLQGKSRLTILVHGYNNTEEEAQQSYAAFLNNTSLERHPQTGHVCEFYWPGNLAIPGASAASYPFQIDRAVKSAHVLREYLSSTFWNMPLDLCLIAHSLGSRLVLEFVSAALERQRPVLQALRVCLMAAAVPIEFVEKNGCNPRLHSALESISTAKVLYSSYDQALGWAFRWGQAFAGESTVEAVGLQGRPAVWHAAVDLAPYAHGDYWPRRESAAETRLLFRLPTRRYILPRAPFSRRITSALALPPLRRLPSRTTLALDE